MATAKHSHWHILSRVCASTLGSYAFAWGFVAIVAASMIAVGFDFHEATDLAYMLGFLAFLGAFCFAFIAGSLMRVWVVLAGGGAALTLAGWWLSKSLA